MSSWRDFGAVSAGLVLGAWAAGTLDDVIGRDRAISQATSVAVAHGAGGMMGGAVSAWIGGRDAPRAPVWLAITAAAWLLYSLAQTRSDHERELGSYGLTGAVLGVLAGARLWAVWREMRRG